MAKKWSKRNLFGKFYMGYLIVIAAGLVLLGFYTRGVMVDYETSQPDKYVINLVEKAGKNDKALGQYLQKTVFSDKSEYAHGDTAALSKEFYRKVSKGLLEAKEDLANSSENLLVYNVSADGAPLVTVAIEKTGSKNALGMLNIPEYALRYAFLRNPESEKKSITLSEDGTAIYTVVLPEDFSVSVDGAKIESFESEEPCEIEAFADIEEYDVVPNGKKVRFTLGYEADIQVLNNAGNPVKLDYFAGVYYASPDYEPSEEAKGVLSEIGDPIAMYKLWARFTRLNDVGGPSFGLSRVQDECRLLPDSPIDKEARTWITLVDISFVSDFNDYNFTASEVDNCILYNDKFFSCDVRLTLDVDTVGTGVVTDNFYNRMFFVYNEDKSLGEEGWYWVGQFDLSGI